MLPCTKAEIDPLLPSEPLAAMSAHEDRQPREKVEWLEQELGGAVAKGTFELVHHQTIAVAAQPLERERGSTRRRQPPGSSVRPMNPTILAST